MPTTTTMPTTTPRTRRLAAVLAASTCAALLGACSAPAPRACTDLRPGEATRAIMLLSDGRSPALDAAVDSLVDDPAAAFASPSLGFEATDDETVAGTVVLATYGDDGAIEPRGTFNLEGTGSDPARREADAQRQADCLRSATDELPKAGGGDLLRTLTPAAQSIAATSPEDSALVAIGLGRSSIEAEALAQIDLSAAGQDEVFTALEEVALIPDLAREATAVRFLAPSEGVESAIAAAGIDAFADALCARTGAAACTSGTTLR